ncbi:MAG: LamG domain-containing protein [Candidatus Methanoperedens sp.]
MVLLTPHPIKRIYGLKDRNWPPWGKSRTETPPDEWDNRAGLVLWLTDNGKGASVWQDSSGADNHGTVYGATAPPAATPGALGYTFDGTDDYIDCGNSASLNIANAVTVGLWIYLPVGYSSASTSHMFLIARDGWMEVSFREDTGVLNTKLGNAAPLPTTKNAWAAGWYNIMCAHNGTTQEIYINSVIDNSRNVAPAFTNSNTLFIGEYFTGILYFTGSIDDVRIYNRALEQKEITSYFQHTRGKYGV